MAGAPSVHHPDCGCFSPQMQTYELPLIPLHPEQKNQFSGRAKLEE